MPRSNVIVDDIWRLRKEDRGVAEREAKEHRKNENGCPYRVGVTIGSDRCRTNKIVGKSLCRECTKNENSFKR